MHIQNIFDFVASTIIGARVLNQLDESLKAFNFKINDELLAKIEEIQKDILYPMDKLFFINLIFFNEYFNKM